MHSYRRLPGLPPYGPPAIGFPPEWGSLGREGLVVEFVPANGSVWVGNFRPGLGGIDAVRSHPNGREVLIMSSGALWSVDPETRTVEEMASAILGVWTVGSEDLLLNDQDLAFIRLGRVGVVWHTRRISWDGFDNLQLEEEKVIGEAWSPIEDRWLPFSVNLDTGIVDGGSYNGPEMHFEYLQPERRSR